MIDAIGVNNGFVNKKAILLEQKLQSIEDEQGFLGKFWNSVKEATTLGVSTSDCDEMLDKYRKGEISFEEAISYLDEFDSKQENMSGLLKNIVTGIGSIAVATTAVAAGPIGWALAFAKGAPIGAAIKAGLGIIDRATNSVDNDELDLKQVGKDAISGAVTGATSAVSSGVGVGIKTGQFGTSVVNGVKCGAVCGSMSGASSYLTDVAFGDKEFKLEDLAHNTLVSGATSAFVGGVVGAGMYGNASLSGTIGKELHKTTGQVIVQDSGTSSLRKILGNGVKNTINA